MPDLLLTEVPPQFCPSDKLVLKGTESGFRAGAVADADAAAAACAALQGAWATRGVGFEASIHTSGHDARFVNVAIALVAAPAELHVRIWKHNPDWITNVSVDYAEVRAPRRTAAKQHTNRGAEEA